MNGSYPTSPHQFCAGCRPASIIRCGTGGARAVRTLGGAREPLNPRCALCSHHRWHRRPERCDVRRAPGVGKADRNRPGRARPPLAPKVVARVFTDACGGSNPGRQSFSLLNTSINKKPFFVSQVVTNKRRDQIVNDSASSRFVCRLSTCSTPSNLRHQTSRRGQIESELATHCFKEIDVGNQPIHRVWSSCYMNI